MFSLLRETYTINLLILTIIFLICHIPFTLTVGGNLHMSEGISNADIIGSDIFFEIIDPPDLEYTYRIRPAKDFGAPFNSSFTLPYTKLVPMNPLNGCEDPENAEEIEGNVAFAERGECSFLHKTLVAEKAGARAVIITEAESLSVMDSAVEHFIEMIDDKSSRDADIPAGFLLGRSGMEILRTLRNLHLSYAIINLPINLTYVPIHMINQPPWITW